MRSKSRSNQDYPDVKPPSNEITSQETWYLNNCKNDYLMYHVAWTSFYMTANYLHVN